MDNSERKKEITRKKEYCKWILQCNQTERTPSKSTHYVVVYAHVKFFVGEFLCDFPLGDFPCGCIYRRRYFFVDFFCDNFLSGNLSRNRRIHISLCEYNVNCIFLKVYQAVFIFLTVLNNIEHLFRNPSP